MWELADRLILIILSYVLFVHGQSPGTSTVYFYVLLTLSGLLYCFKHSLITCTLLIIYGICCIINPVFLFFSPGFFLDYLKLKGYYRLGYLTLLPVLYRLPDYPALDCFSFALFFLLSIMLFRQTGLIEKYCHELIIMKDSSTELKMVLEEKNRNLIARQDTEIYLARLQERNRIAREIHDNVGHLLTRSILQAKAISTISKEENLDTPMEQLSETLNLAMNSIRTSVHDLHDESIDLESGIRQALSCLTNFQVTLDYDIGTGIPKEYKYTFIAIAKETANNMVKHSNGTKAVYIFREHPGLYQFSIEDNGITVENSYFEREMNAGIGLQNIQTRVEHLNGHMNIKTDNGFRILITLPKKPLGGT